MPSLLERFSLPTFLKYPSHPAQEDGDCPGSGWTWVGGEDSRHLDGRHNRSYFLFFFFFLPFVR
eukprot:1114674-Prorocentrum_lima.AAC.1